MIKKKLQKIFIGTSVIGATIIIPVVAVACGADNNQEQTNITDLISKIESASIKANTAGAQISPSALNSSNINQYITGLPSAPTGINYTYQLSTPNDQAGSINLIITVSSNTINQVTNSMIINGFKISTPTDTQIVNNIVNAINATPTAIKANTAGAQISPSTLNSSNINQYITGLPPVPVGTTYTFALTNSDNTTGTIDVVVTVTKSTISIASRTIKVIGFLNPTQSLQIFQNLINSIALTPNVNFAAPQQTSSATSITNAFAILAPFTIDFKQLSSLQAISNLTINVTSSNFKTGSAELTFTGNISELSQSYSKQFTGFSQSNAATITTNIKNYFATPTNALHFLGIFINLNPDWIYDFISNNSDGLFQNYKILSGANGFKLNQMGISYNYNNGYFDISGELNGKIEIQNWGGISFTSQYESTPDTTLTLILPISMDESTGQGLFSGLLSSLNINVNNIGLTTLSWNLKPVTASEPTFGIDLKNIIKQSDNSNVANLNIGYKLTTTQSQSNATPAAISNIVF